MTSGPEAVFAAAAAAMARGDWEAFFACLDPADLTVLAGHGLGLAASPDPVVQAEVRALGLAHGIPAAAFDALVAAAEAVTASAERMVGAAARTPPDPVDLADSLRHRDLVKAFDGTLRAAVTVAPDRAALTAALERFRRAREGGGAVSSSLFVDEELVDVRVDGRRAVGQRRRHGTPHGPIVFTRTRTGWLIRLFGRPPRARA